MSLCAIELICNLKKNELIKLTEKIKKTFMWISGNSVLSFLLHKNLKAPRKSSLCSHENILRREKCFFVQFSLSSLRSGQISIELENYISVLISTRSSCTFPKMSSTPIVTITRKESFSAAHRLHRFHVTSGKWWRIRNVIIFLASTYHRRRIAKYLENATMRMVTVTTTSWKFLFADLLTDAREW